MRQTLLLLSLLVQMLFASQAAWTQSNYPIYVSPTLLPPYSLKLSDYSAFGSQRMMVTIVVNDLEVANLPVKLRVKMETAGVSIENPITINTTPIYIDGGSATVLFGEDLVDYFNINNLQFKGYSKEAYSRSGQLPEGFYRFSVEVLHFHTNRVISNTGSVTAWIALGKPPVLRTPSNDVELGQFMGVPLTFSWLASNVGSPVSAGSVRYKFEMWEVRVKGVNPYTIVGSMPVFHEFVTSSTSYSFNPAAVMMEEGLTYAWRVTAFDESGLVPFEQNGQSEVRTFRYKSLCEEVQSVTTAASGQKGSFTWTPDRNHTSYNVEVRNTASDWFLASETFDSKVEFYELERGQTYEIRVQAVCNGNASSVSDYTAWTALTIPEAQPKDNTDDCPDCGCSDDLPDVTLINFELRQDLAPGDTLSNKTGTTRFVVKSVEPQGNGIYKGVFYFWAEIWGVKIPCDFWDLQVNTDNVIVNMDYKSINDPMFLVDVDALIEAGNEFMDNMAVVTTSTAIVDTIPVIEDFDYLVVQDGQLVAIVLNADGEPVPIPLNISAERAEKALITNEFGDEVVVTSKGEVMGVKEYQATGGNSRLMQDYKKEKESNELSEGSMVHFAPHAAQRYGFDDFNEEKTALQHLYPTLHNGYRPAFKSVESFRYDKVGVDLTAGLSFRDEMGVPAIAMDGGVSVQGTQAGSNRAFYAYRALTDSTEELVGKLNIMSFDNAPKRVHIIPVNDAKIPSQIDLETTLYRVYSQAVATWTVVPEEGVTLEFPGGNMTHDGSGGLSTYNRDQEAIVKAYVASGRKLERDDLYLFYVKDATFKDRSLAGYMPLQRQVGFIYGKPSLAIVAHELGHGAFNLRHTFSPKALIAQEFDTQNLMDYDGGTELWQHQWDLIHNPESILFSWSQDESEGAMIGKGKLAIFDDIYENFEKYTLSFEGENYKIPYPYNKNIEDQTDKSSTSYIYVDYDLDQMLKVREIFRKQYYNIKDVDALNTLIENDVDAWKDMVKSDVPQHNINSPMTVKAINQNKLNIIDFDYSAVISQFDERWGNKNWDFTGTLDNSKMNRQSFALVSIQGNALDMESFYQLNDDVLYQIDNKKHYNQRNEKVLYNKEEIRYWCYGYYLAKMNFSYREAISLGMQFFNSLDVYSFDKYSRTKDLPWRVDALLDGYSGFYSDRNLDIIDVPFIDMYKVYERTAGQDEFDIDWDLNEFTLDAALVFCTSGMYSIGKTTIQVGSKLTMGAGIDITLQIALAKLDGSSNEEAYQQIVWSDVIYSGVETLHSKWAMQSAMACMRTAFNEMGSKYDYNAVGFECTATFVSNFLAHKLIGTNDRFSKHIRKCLGENASETINGLWVLGLDKETVEWIVAHTMGESFKEGVSSIIDNQFKNGKKR